MSVVLATSAIFILMAVTVFVGATLFASITRTRLNVDIGPLGLGLFLAASVVCAITTIGVVA